MSRLFSLNRSLIRCRGTHGEASDFLQGLVTNDVRLLNNSKCLYALFLNKFGRILYDSIIYKLPVDRGDEENFLIECDEQVANSLMRHLKLYRIRRKVDILLTDEFRLWCLDTLNSDNVKESKDLLTFVDPRVKELGLRIITSADTNLRESLKTDVVGSNATHCDYIIHRYKFGIGEGIVDLLPEKAFPLECNADFMNGVSFHKGCYIGQELTARTHHTGVVRKRLMPLIFENNIKMTDNVDIKNEEKQSIGKLRNIVGSYGLGLMRIEQTLSANSLNYNENICKTEKPFWWPKASEVV